METDLASETSCFHKKLDDGQVPKKKIVSDNFSCVVFSFLDFLSFGDGTNRLSQNVCKELTLYSA